MRNIVFRFESAPLFSRALLEGDQDLGLPDGETVGDGEWVLTIFEIGEKRRATAAAARGLHRGPGTLPVVAFERRDWERLVDFAGAASTRMPGAPVVFPPEPPTDRTVFVPELPDEASEDAPENEVAAWADPENADCRVLLVDDDPEFCAVVKAMLAAVGLRASAAASAEDALLLIRAKTPDLVVLDWNLPGMTGIDLCRIIRKDPTVSRLPVLFLTANAGPNDLVEAFASGADDYVVKPFRGPELGARIFGLLRRARMAPVGC